MFLSSRSIQNKYMWKQYWQSILCFSPEPKHRSLGLLRKLGKCHFVFQESCILGREGERIITFSLDENTQQFAVNYYIYYEKGAVPKVVCFPKREIQHGNKLLLFLHSIPAQCSAEDIPTQKLLRSFLFQKGRHLVV